MSYFGHIARHDSLQKTVLTGRTDGRRGRGRTRRQWYDNIKEQTGNQISMNIQLAQDRLTWRSVASRLQNSPQQQQNNNNNNNNNNSNSNSKNNNNYLPSEQDREKTLKTKSNKFISQDTFDASIACTRKLLSQFSTVVAIYKSFKMLRIRLVQIHGQLLSSFKAVHLQAIFYSFAQNLLNDY